MNKLRTEKCTYCGIKTEAIGGPVHRYLVSTPGCWRKFGEILAREYEDIRLFKCHDLTVDAYALQHPGVEGNQTINSSNIHLVSLYAYFVMKTDLSELSRIKQNVAKRKREFFWLEPPHDMKELNIGCLNTTDNPDAYCSDVEEWARYVFLKWEEHHEVARLHFKEMG